MFSASRGVGSSLKTKSAASRRTVYLVDTAVAALKRHRVDQAQRWLYVGSAWEDNNLVFASAIGTFLDPTNVHHRFERALERTHLPRVRLHDLRHGAATLALEQGIHPKIVQEMLGHSSYTLTMNTYSHVTPALHREAARTMSRVFSRTNMHGDPTVTAGSGA